MKTGILLIKMDKAHFTLVNLDILTVKIFKIGNLNYIMTL